MPSGRSRSIAALLAMAAIAVLAACAGPWRPRPEVLVEASSVPTPNPRVRLLGWIVAAAAAAALLGGGATLFAVQQQSSRDRWAMAVTHGDPDRAPALMLRNGCTGCHTVPGMSGARGSAGPALSGLADRAFIGGTLPNTPENLVRWIRNSRGVNARTAMPSTGISDAEARDIAAYLYAVGTGR